MWIASEVRLRVRIQWLMYRKRPGGRHDLPEHSFEHSNMHTSRRPASLMLTGLHTPESPVEPTGPDDTGSTTQTCITDQLCNGMQRGPLPSPCSENRHHTPHAADSTSCAHAHEFRSSTAHACCRCCRHNRGTCSLHPPPGGPRPPGATQGIRAGAEPLPAHAASSGSRAARCPSARSRNRPRAPLPGNQQGIRGCARAARAGDDDRAA